MTALKEHNIKKLPLINQTIGKDQFFDGIGLSFSSNHWAAFIRDPRVDGNRLYYFASIDVMMQKISSTYTYPMDLIKQEIAQAVE